MESPRTRLGREGRSSSPSNIGSPGRSLDVVTDGELRRLSFQSQMTEAVAVLLATDFVSEVKLRLAIGAGGVELASEDEIRGLCPDCDLGAAHTFGNLYGLPVYVSPSLEEDETIAFNAGTHEDALRIRYADFKRLAAAQVVPLSRHD